MLVLYQRADATHLRAADILVEPVCGTLTYKISIIVYLNSASNTQFGTDSQIYFGDGDFQRIPLTRSTPRPDLGQNVNVASFITTHTYATPGNYTVTYVEHDRSKNIVNIANSEDVAYASYVSFIAEPGTTCNRFPVLPVAPLDRGCSGVTFYHSAGAYDPEGDSLSYEMTIPESFINTSAFYTSPADNKFYTDFAHGNETKNGIPSISIDSAGTVTWNAPGAIGEYNIAFKIIEWRQDPVTHEYQKISTTIRDMQIIIEECVNQRPELEIPQDICVVAGTSINETVLGIDPENHPVKIEAFSNIFDLDEAESSATHLPDSAIFVPSDPPAKMFFLWKTQCSHVRQQPYQVTFKITDSPPSGPKLVTFKTWNIRVIAPPPVISNVVLDVVRKYGVLEWNAYTCHAKKIQVWRKVGSFSMALSQCVTGIPKNSGYTLIAELDPDATSYMDTNKGQGLLSGAMYCYRLVMLVADTKSIVSNERCIGPVIRDAPVITNVTVQKTDEQGEIRVSWAPASDLKPEQFPPPYRYEVFRANDFIGETDITSAGTTEDTTLVDTPLNTIDDVFNYRIVLYAKPKFSDSFVPVDTSAQASSVKLAAVAGLNKIFLHWQDSVPWTNIVAERPYHLIYRGTNFEKDDQLELIDSVQVIENGFYFIDEGQAGHEVNNHTFYNYRIVTVGSYGNPALGIQKNSSQTISVYPENTLKPCPPFLDIEITDCETYVHSNTCDQISFTNVIRWSPDLYDTCRIDIVQYKVYAANTPDSTFTLLATVDTVGFVDRNLTSPSRCYRVSAVDAKGQEGPMSDAQCNDTCPYFTLPNVFTPNADGCNDIFSAVSYDANPDCPVIDLFSCPRFVRNVKIKIYNRWGKEVYHYAAEDHELIGINWNGTDEQGKEMPSGIYYYVAEIEFSVLEKKRRQLVLKDWVHLIR